MVRNKKFLGLNLTLPAWATILFVGLVLTAFPPSLILLPLVGVAFLRQLYVLQKGVPPTEFKKIELQLIGVHLILGVITFFYPYGLFLKIIAATWHVCCALFWFLYGKGSRGVSNSGRVYRFLIWSAFSFFLMWGVVALDKFVLGGAVQTDLYHQIFEQATALRKTLFESKVSPYQLPEGIRVLLEQGPEVWSHLIMGQLLPAFYGLWMVLFYFYWNGNDLQLKRFVKVPLYQIYRLPDWTMILLIVSFGIWAISQWGGVVTGDGEPSTFDVGAMGGHLLVGILWWYGIEGLSILIILGHAIRRFWVFFGLALLVFFDARFTEMLIMAIGIGAQIKRFLPAPKPKMKP
jgi:hypothetical protein